MCFDRHDAKSGARQQRAGGDIIFIITTKDAIMLDRSLISLRMIIANKRGCHGARKLATRAPVTLMSMYV